MVGGSLFSSRLLSPFLTPSLALSLLLSPSQTFSRLADVYPVAAPQNNRGDAVVLAVRQAVEKTPGACWVLVSTQGLQPWASASLLHGSSHSAH